MNLETQFKVIFYSFVYGMFFIATFKGLKKIKLKKNFFKVLLELLFCFFHAITFYFLLYRIDYGILGYYIIVFVILGGIFCQLLYFKDKNT